MRYPHMAAEQHTSIRLRRAVVRQDRGSQQAVQVRALFTPRLRSLVGHTESIGPYPGRDDPRLRDVLDGCALASETLKTS